MAASANASNSKESRIKRGLNNAVKLYRLIISDRLRPSNSISSSATTKEAAHLKLAITSEVREENSPHDETCHEKYSTR